MVKYPVSFCAMLALQLVPGTVMAQAGPAAAAPVTMISSALITSADSLTLVQKSVAACVTQGEKPAAFVTDADGNLRAALSADNGNPVGLHTAQRKTAAVFQFHQSTHALFDRIAGDPAFARQYGDDPRYFFHPGAFPLYRDGKFVAVLAVGGGHMKDEGCALAALQAVPWAKTAP